MEISKEKTDVEEINQITEAVIGAAIQVHREIGPGMLESAYEVCLVKLLKSGIERLVNHL